ncbi:MAG: agmatine deiminase family protein [Myxococcales bacterium]|nr:agmatine deiminase family protein [Myxococcales bacterium]
MSDTPLKYRQPAEWTRQRAVWTAWPRLEEEWGSILPEVQREVAHFCNRLAAFETVHLLVCNGRCRKEAAALITAPAVELVPLPYGDIWLRDTGPIFLDGPNQPAAALFRFNGWGGKFAMPHDDEVGRAIADRIDATLFEHDLVCEGGALETDGEGTCLTTKDSLLHPNRNGSMNAATIEGHLKAALGYEKILWLDGQLENDHTDGHIDTLARFVAPGEVVCMEPSPGDPNGETLLNLIESLSTSTDARGRRLKVHRIPSPGLVTAEDGDTLPASYLNFLIVNGAVFVPTYDMDNDHQALAALAPLFPEREVIGIPSRAILSGGGALHCMTQQQPEGNGPR